MRTPSSRRKGGHDQISLNLVPIIDTMVTLIGFMLFTMSFFIITSIESPFPTASSAPEKEPKEKPLQLTITLDKEATEIWSPFNRIKKTTLKNNPVDGTPDLKGIHETLLLVKKQYPAETKIVIVPYSGATYDTLISTMDSVRLLDPLDPMVTIKNPKTGVDETSKLLFPDVIFGNLLGDS